MKIKHIVIILIIILIIFGGFFISTHHLNNMNTVRVGDITYTLPDGYHKINHKTLNDTCITNGKDEIFLAVYGKDNVTQYVNDYVKYKEGNNTTVNITTLNINNIVVYKSTIINDTNNVHYWFANKNKVYSIYSYVENPKRDDIIIDLITSIK